MSTVLLLLVLGIFSVSAAGIPAPDDSEATILPPSLVYKGSGQSLNLQETLSAELHPSCNVDSEDLVTTTRAAVTRVLKGMCCGSSARDAKNNVDDRLFNLESQFADQMNVLKTMLLNMEERMGDVDGNVKKIRNDLRSTRQDCRCPGGQPAGLASRTLPLSGMTDDHDPNNKFARDAEIQLYNSSIYFIATPSDIKNSSDEQRVFTYFWRIKDMANKLRNWDTQRSIRSPSFYISAGSYKMYMRMFPRQKNGENVYLHVSLTKGEHDATLFWPFSIKMRVSVLDQRPENIQDINSRVWDPSGLCSEYNWKRPTGQQDNDECVGLGFPQDMLNTRDYVVRNTMVVKLTLYLDL